MKRFLQVSVLVLLFAVLSCVCVNAKEYSGTFGSTDWVYDDVSCVLTISGSGGVADNVTAMQYPWHEYRKSIKSVVIEDSVTSIGKLAFASCSNLTDVKMGANVNRIGSSAFSYCSSLKKIELPEKIDRISASLFIECTSLEEIIIPEKVTLIDTFAFYSCTSLKSVEFGENIAVINDHAFSECHNLNSVHIKNLEKWCAVEMESMNASPCYNGADLYVNDEKITMLVFDNITKINDYVFYGCESIVNLNVGGNVAEIGKYAFGKCSNIKSAVIKDNVAVMGNGVFNQCSSLEKVELSKNLSKLGTAVFGYCTKLDNVKIPQGVTVIDALAFRNCTGLTKIEIPKGVTSIGEGAFFDCTNLTDVYYGGNKEEWNSITVIQYNDALKNAVVHYNSALKIEAVIAYTYTDGNVVIQVENITDGSILIIKGTKNGVDTVYVRKYVYDEDISVEIGEGYENIKIMVWKSLDSLVPLCEGVIVH